MKFGKSAFVVEPIGTMTLVFPFSCAWQLRNWGRGTTGGII